MSIIFNFPYLQDSSFLKNFDKTKLKEQYVKIIVLTFQQEKPIAEIQGIIVNGNITIDGNSALRRTCNLNAIADSYKNDLTDTKHLLSINKKVQILIGFENNTEQYKEYSKIWFPQGIFVIVGSSITKDSNGTNISLTLHDKMALLNGECGGTFPASVVVNQIDITDEDGLTSYKRINLFQTIYQLVNHWGGQQLGKILVNDIDLKIKMVVKWLGQTPFYYYQYPTSGNVHEYKYNTDIETLIDDLWTEDKTRTRDAIKNTIQKFEYGEDIGYILSDFQYNGQLIANPGETVTSILDKIKNMLGNYQYFYDINGNFIFREIKNYLNTTYSTVKINELKKDNYLIDYTDGKSVYTFNNGELIISYSNNPQFQQIKNDFMVWGIREDKKTSIRIPIRYHLVIDKKPEIGKSHSIFFYQDEYGNIRAKKPTLTVTTFTNLPREGELGEYYYVSDEKRIYRWSPASPVGRYVKTNYTSITVPSPPLVYETKSKFPQQGKEETYYQVEGDNSIFRWEQYSSKLSDYQLVPKGQKKGKKSYNDRIKEAIKAKSKKFFPIQGQLNIDYYDETAKRLYIWKATASENIRRNHYIGTDYKIKTIKSKDFRQELYYQGIEAEQNALHTNYYYTQLVNEWPKIFNLETQSFKQQYIDSPETMDYFLDFIDTNSPIDDFNVNNIGRRTHTLNNDKINCVFEPDFPQIVYIESDTEQTQEIRTQCENMQLQYMQIDQDTFSKFAIGGYLNSAYEQIKNEIYQFTNYNEQVSLTTIPIYYLEPNIRITIQDSESGVHGDYVIKNISLPLGVAESMSISCIRAVQRI